MTAAWLFLVITLSSLINYNTCMSPAAGNRPQQIVDDTGNSQEEGLNTYAVTAENVDIQTGIDGGRHGTTRVKVMLTNQLQQAMSVVTASVKSGMVHNFIDSFRFLRCADASL